MPDEPHHTTQPRSGNGKWVRTPESAARDARAAELRAQGKTFQQIADELGLANKGDAHHAVERALAEIVKGPAEALRDLELSRLDTMYEAAMGVLERQHVTVSNGKVVHLSDDPLPDDGPVLQAIDRLLKIQERRAKLLGLDAEKKVSLSGGVKYEVVGIDPDDLK